MTAPIEPARTFRGVPFYANFGAPWHPLIHGVSYQQVLDVIHGVAAKARIAGAAFVEYVPEKDPSGIGAQAIARLASNVIAALGRQAVS